MNEFFHKQNRKFRKRNGHRRRNKRVSDLASKLKNCLREYKSGFFVFNVCVLVLSLPAKWMGVIWSIFECWRQKHEIPDRISVLLKDLIAFRRRQLRIYECNGNKEVCETSGYMTILYHNKGIDMVNLPRILSSKYVRDAVPSFVHNTTPSIVSFKYMKTIAGKIFNHTKTIEDLDVSVCTSNKWKKSFP